MTMEEEALNKPQEQVVLIIDHDNMHLGVKDLLHESMYKIGVIKEVVEKYGVLCKDISKVYWGPYYHKIQGVVERRRYYNTPQDKELKREVNILHSYRKNFGKHGIKTFTEEECTKKSIVDSYIICDVMKMLCRNSKIDVFVLCTGDQDFIPLIEEIKKHGKTAVGIGVGNGSDTENNTASSYLIKTYIQCGFKYYNYIELKKSWDEKHKSSIQREANNIKNA